MGKLQVVTNVACRLLLFQRIEPDGGKPRIFLQTVAHAGQEPLTLYEAHEPEHISQLKRTGITEGLQQLAQLRLFPLPPEPFGTTGIAELVWVKVAQQVIAPIGIAHLAPHDEVAQTDGPKE